MDIIQEAKHLAGSGGRACAEDIDLLMKVIEKLEPKATIVKLGQNPALSLVVRAMMPDCNLWLVDNNIEGQNWELKAHENCGFNTREYRKIIGTGLNLSDVYSGVPIDLLILDLHSKYEEVMIDLSSWCAYLNKAQAFVFVHDYDADSAPTYLPDVARAANEFFKKRFSWRGGWSAVWKIAVK